MTELSPLTSVLIVYIGIIWLITIVATCLDKFFAKRDMFRISERTLILLALLGGAIPEYATMKIIRHKTLHRKFMIGLPLIMVLQITAVFVFIYLHLKGTV